MESSKFDQAGLKPALLKALAFALDLPYGHDFPHEKESDSSHVDLANVHVYVALSGGLDSSVLLHLLSLLQTQYKPQSFNLSAIHVNHQLSPNAAQWQEFCAQKCRAYNISFASQTVTVNKKRRQSLEALARELRYQALCDSLKNMRNDHQDTACSKQKICIALGQHKDDQAETFLLQLKRGAGVKGLSAMASRFKRHETEFVRPLLDFTREQLASFAKHQHLEWIEDESNDDEQFDRNYLRQKVMPVISQRWPQFNTTLSRSARLCAEADTVISEYMASLAPTICKRQDHIEIVPFSALSLPTKRSFLRHWLSAFLEAAPSFKQLEDVLRLSDDSTKASAYIQIGQHAIERFQDTLVISDISHLKAPDFSNLEIDVNFDHAGKFQITDTITLKQHADKTACKGKVYLLPKLDLKLGFAGSNLKFKAYDNRPSKTLKYWYQEWGISPMQRHKVAVIYSAKQAYMVIIEGQVSSSASLIQDAIYTEIILTS